MKRHPLAIIGPGLLVAATGVGAGDLATGALSGSKLGVAVLWAVLVGAGMKWLLTEGLARWQLATGTTLLQGCVTHFGRPLQWLFLAYLLVWSFFVSSALMSACGIASHSICPVFGAEADKIVYGLLHSAAAVLLVRLGGYQLFAKVMSVCIAVMFVTAIATAIAIGPSWTEVARGLALPTIPQMRAEGIQWTIALMGGVGGTVTVLCYGYWIREEGRVGPEDLRVCRLDLAAGYAMIALFGMAMVIIGSTIEVEGKGATLIVQLADQLQSALGSVARWVFLVGAWCAIFSSLLGVWQSVPYLFADFWRLMRSAKAVVGPEGVAVRDGVASAERVPGAERSGAPEPHDPSLDSTDLQLPRSRPYQVYLFALATIPAAGVFSTGFEFAQKSYAIVGALFIPMLALALLVLGSPSSRIGRRHRNAPLVSLLLIATLAFFALAGWLEIRNKVFRTIKPSPANFSVQQKP